MITFKEFLTEEDATQAIKDKHTKPVFKYWYHLYDHDSEMYHSLSIKHKYDFESSKEHFGRQDKTGKRIHAHHDAIDAIANYDFSPGKVNTAGMYKDWISGKKKLKDFKQAVPVEAPKPIVEKPKSKLIGLPSQQIKNMHGIAKKSKSGLAGQVIRQSIPNFFSVARLARNPETAKDYLNHHDPMIRKTAEKALKNVRS